MNRPRVQIVVELGGNGPVALESCVFEGEPALHSGESDDQLALHERPQLLEGSDQRFLAARVLGGVEQDALEADAEFLEPVIGGSTQSCGIHGLRGMAIACLGRFRAGR